MAAGATTSPFGSSNFVLAGERSRHPVPKRTILIVEGAVHEGGALERRLSGLGYEVMAVGPWDGATAGAPGEAVPEIALVDLARREWTAGMEAAAELRRRRDLAIVALIAEPEEEFLQRTGATELEACIAMPCTDRELHLGIELALSRHAAARAVHELEERFFASSIDMLCILDFNGHFKRLSPSWERTLGFPRTELTTRPFIEFVHPDDRERTLAQNSAVRSGGQALDFENRYLCKDGAYRWFRWNATVDTEKRVIYSVARDITESKQAEEEREQLVRELQDALAEVNTLRDILPICSYCKKIRDDENFWHSVESYFARHTTTRLSHGICPSCMESQVEPQIRGLNRG
jgi:PAS domain S-box-containing protein